MRISSRYVVQRFCDGVRAGRRLGIVVVEVDWMDVGCVGASISKL